MFVQDTLYKMVTRQLKNLFGLCYEERMLLKNTINNARERSLNCINYYTGKNKADSVNALYGDHYVIFLYYLSNNIYHMDSNNKISNDLSDKVYLLNKMLFGCDIWGVICTNFRKIDKVAVWGFYVFQ